VAILIDFPPLVQLSGKRASLMTTVEDSPKVGFVKEKGKPAQHIETSDDEVGSSDITVLEEAYTTGHHPDPSHPLNLPR
jgi:hypothetical protein